MPRPALQQMLRELIAAPSVSSVSPEFDTGNRLVIDLLAGWLEDLGFVVRVDALPHHPAKANLVATLGAGPGGLVLAGHADTVPCNPELWRDDPWTLTERDGALHGLGASDMKSFFAFALEVAARVDHKALREPLVVVATADEESTMAGAKALAAAGRLPGRWAVIGEPTSGRPVHAHKGVFMERAIVTGRAGHSSDPRLGVNAIDAMHRLIAELISARAELAAANPAPQFGVPHPTVNLGRIVGGDNPNRICPACSLSYDCRVVPGMDPAATRDALRRRLERAVAGTGAAIAFEALLDGVPPYTAPAGSALVEAAEQLLGMPSEAVAFATEAPYFGMLGIEALVAGPGDLKVAHQPDEALRLAAIPAYLEFLERMVERCCLRAA